MSTYSFTLRDLTGPSGSTTKHNKLTIQEMDSNLIYLYDLAKEAANPVIIPIINITFNNLYTALFNGTLIPEQKYRLTDYKSVNYIHGFNTAMDEPTPVDNNFVPDELYYGATESFIVTAITNNKIDNKVISELYPYDEIYYTPYVREYGYSFNIYSGATLPNSTTIPDFNLQFDGTNVYFNMPSNYPVLYGHFLNIYITFNTNSYNLNFTFEPMLPNDIITPDYYTSTYGYSYSRIKIEGNKIILLDLTETDYNNYDVDSLTVETIYDKTNKIMKGFITRRIDTINNISLPVDWRNFKYRRWEINTPAINEALLIEDYIGITDTLVSETTTGNYKDYNILPIGCSNITITNNGSPDFCLYNLGGLDNLVIKKISANVIFNEVINSTYWQLKDSNIKQSLNDAIYRTPINRTTINSSYNNILSGVIESSNFTNFGDNIGNINMNDVSIVNISENIFRNTIFINIKFTTFNDNTLGITSSATTIGYLSGDVFTSNNIIEDFNNNTINTSLNNNFTGIFNYNNCLNLISNTFGSMEFNTIKNIEGCTISNCGYTNFSSILNNKDLTPYATQLSDYTCSIINVNSIPHLQFYDGTNMQFIEIT